MRRLPARAAAAAAAAIALAALAPAAPAIATPKPEVTAVEPARTDCLLTCAVRTAHLPGDRLSSSLESGLPSAIEMDLDLFDERNRVVGKNRVFLRIAFDLWEEVFRVEGVGAPRDFADRAQLERFLARIPELPVTALSGLHGARRHRIRVGLELHPVAPRETERLGDWVAGGAAAGSETDDPDGREVSVSLGQVIRFFYKGARRPGAAEAERFSAWFVPDDLPAPAEAEGERAPAAD
jgi:hypothetical protein